MMIQNFTSEAFNFISEYKDKLKSLTDNPRSNKIKALEGSLERVKQISEQLSKSQYRLVFIGTPGSGKTTTICNYLGLTKDVQEGGALQGFNLLETASGRTTAAEVHIRKADRTALIIHPIEITVQNALIRDYCSYVFRWLAYPSKSENTEEPVQEPDNSASKENSSEYDKIIRSMLGYRTEDEFVNDILNKYTSDELERFVADSLKNTALDSRTQTVFDCPEADNKKVWLQKTFRNINYGKLDTAPIPEQIDVLLNPSEIDCHFPEFISEVIDTRGYDGYAREDLQGFINAQDTICIILDDVKSLPNEKQRRILTEWIDADQKDTINRVALLINTRGTELSEVADADGDEELGEQIKRNELQNKIKKENLHYKIENTLFIDPYAGIDSSTKGKIISYEQESRTAMQTKITKHLETMIRDQKRDLSEEAEQLENAIEQLYSIVSTPSENRIIENKLNEISIRTETLKDEIIGGIRSCLLKQEHAFCEYFRRHVHWRSAKTTVSMNGNWHNANIYSIFSGYCEQIIKTQCYSRKEKIIAYIGELDQCEAKPEEIAALISTLTTTITFEFSQMLSFARENVKELCKNAFAKDFWIEARDVQTGKGYYGRLLSEISRQMIASKLCNDTVNTITNAITSWIEEINKALRAPSENEEE